eukprot:3470767-Pyramimonas_sp.AAC.1
MYDGSRSAGSARRNWTARDRPFAFPYNAYAETALRSFKSLSAIPTTLTPQAFAMVPKCSKSMSSSPYLANSTLNDLLSFAELPAKLVAKVLDAAAH